MEHMMGNLIAVVDLTTGIECEREEETLTLDIPADFDREASEVFVDADKLARYRTAKGETRVCSSAPTYLSGRAPGEECLVATQDVDFTGAVCTRHYWRSVVNPLH
jgi:hypothetical protein